MVSPVAQDNTNIRNVDINASSGIEPTIPVFKRTNTLHALGHKATVTDGLRSESRKQKTALFLNPREGTMNISFSGT
jgi:hypothetical protein